jgi:hypothetical protein
VTTEGFFEDPLSTDQGQPLKHCYSVAYKLATAELLAVQPHSSMKRFQLLQAHTIHNFVLEATASGITSLAELTPERIIEFCPSPKTLGRSLELLQHVLDDELQKFFGTGVRAVFIIHDAGNKKKDKLQQRLFAGFDFLTGTVKVMHVAASRIGGLNLVDVIIADLERLNIDLNRVYGSAQDNAGDVAVTFVQGMHAKIPKFIGVGCVLHILNLMIMRSIFVAFGEQRKPGEKGGAGGNGVIRVGFMVHYLITLNADMWRSWAKKNGYGHIAFIPTGASEGRWWSVSQAAQDVFENYQAYSEFFAFMANKNDKSVYCELYKDVSAWLLNKKLHADLAYVLAHHEAWWNFEFQFAQTAAEWMKDLPVEDQVGGFRCEEYTVKVVMLRLQLLDIVTGASEDCPIFEEWRKRTELLPPELQEAALLQHQAFMRTVLAMQMKHHTPWLTRHLGCVLCHFNATLALWFARFMLARLDGKPDPVIDEPELELYDTAVDLRELISHALHFIPDQVSAKRVLLEEPCVLFQEPGFVEELRAWVEADGDYTDLPRGPWLRETMIAGVRGRPFHSGAAERSVNASNHTDVPHNSRGSTAITSIKTSLIFRFRSVQRAAGAVALRARGALAAVVRGVSAPRSSQPESAVVVSSLLLF